MRIWPVLLDCPPAYMRGPGRSRSLLLAPIGTSTLLEHLVSSIMPITGHPPAVMPQTKADAEYRRWIHEACPTARVVDEPGELTDVFGNCELSDAFLIIDPRWLPVGDLQLSALVQHYSGEPRVAHHLVVLEAAVTGTKERVSFDTSGQVRGIHRHLEEATWPFMAGLTATIVPGASGILPDGLQGRSLMELRQLLAARGIPSRDVAVEGQALDLGEERGMLAANELITLKAAIDQQTDRASAAPLLIGSGHKIDAEARLVGPIVIHPNVCIEKHATVLGPAVIGAGARIASGAVVAHATIGPDCIVPQGRIVRDQAWFQGGDDHDQSLPVDRVALSYGERLARLSIDAPENRQARGQDGSTRRIHQTLKRGLDLTVSALSLAVLSPLLVAIIAVIWLESRRPIFYGDRREGLDGQMFGCWKFRTMRTGAHLAQKDFHDLDHTDGPHFKIDRDPRVTRVGRVLRALNLDEIPQLFNVLLGQMSLVGPRPSPFRENQICVPWRQARLSVRPGITGFWQVCRHDRSAGDFHQWIEYDLLYVQHQSFWLDLKILVATLVTLGGKAGHIPSSWLVGQHLPSVPTGSTPPEATTARRANEVGAT